MKKRGSSINLDIHHSKVPSSGWIKLTQINSHGRLFFFIRTGGGVKEFFYLIFSTKNLFEMYSWDPDHRCKGHAQSQSFSPARVDIILSIGYRLVGVDIESKHKLNIGYRLIGVDIESKHKLNRNLNFFASESRDQELISIFCRSTD